MKMTFNASRAPFEASVRFAYKIDDIEYIYPTEEQAINALRAYMEADGKTYLSEKEPVYSWTTRGPHASLTTTFTWARITKDDRFKMISKNMRIVDLDRERYNQLKKKAEEKIEQAEAKRLKKILAKAKEDNKKLIAERKTEHETRER